MVGAPVTFWCEFSSPYGYVGAEQIGGIAAQAGRPLVWRPFLLGGVFKVTGARPLIEMAEPKGSYFRRDFLRTAGFYGLSITMPQRFPFAAIAATRAAYWVEATAPERMGEVVLALYRACYRDGRAIGEAATVLDVVAEAGFERAAVEAGIAEAAIKQRAIAAGEEALAAGVFGSPFVTVDGERFWGSDRLDQVRKWLVEGPW
ncbi:MAG: 2-hydroxychromene-2-carboxylate isomerase [Alphaproteobacteria bacterium]|nr:2-hydroxychromene-2-carboxylate isomerase [Alphaproteobacteria bacterium]TAD89077.1 MAG: 2-hydroxychromene-2-carboxylate isomerase [Alphaproteobacteria bacterium]